MRKYNDAKHGVKSCEHKYYSVDFKLKLNKFEIVLFFSSKIE